MEARAMTADVELLPCPFCGGAAHLERQGHVCCTTPLCRGFGAFDNYGTPAEQNASAIKRWNTRDNVSKSRLALNQDFCDMRDRAERLAEALREAKEKMLAQVKWEACDCGCERDKPADAASVTWLRASAMLQ